MPRNPTLLSWILPLCVASAPAMSAGLDDVSGREAQAQWASEAAKPAIPLHRGPPADRPKFILQAQTSGTPSPAAGGAPPPGVPDDALKAEMEKRWGDAERIYKELLAKDPGRADLWLRLSDVLAVEGKREETAQALARAADLRPGDADVQFRASQAFGVIDSLADATRYNDRALALRPTDQALLRRRAQLATWANDFRLATKTLKGLIDANPGDPTPKTALAEVRDRLLTLGRLRAADGDIDGALDFLGQYRDAGGDEDTYRREVAEAREDRNAPLRAELEKRWDDAERLYRELLEKEPNRVDALQHLVGVLAEQGKREEAAKFGERLYRLLLEKDPDQVDALRQLAIVLAEQGKGEEAAKSQAQAADLRPDDADLQQQASQTFAAANRLADALRYIDRAIALRPNDTSLLRDRALLATWSGKSDEAEKTLRVLLDADPGNAMVKRDLGRILMWQNKKLPEVASLFTQYLAEHPDDKEVLLDLSRVEAMRGNRKAAADMLRRYREAGGDEQTYRRQLALGAAPTGQRVAGAGRTARPPLAGGAAAPGTPLPPAVIKAKLAKNWGEAERLIRALLAQQPNRADLWLQLVEVLAVQKKTLPVAEAMAKAAELRPRDSKLQLQTSEAFGAADRPADALRYVDRALAISPNDLALHKRRLTLANWAGHYAEAEASLRVLIAADPSDLTLTRDLGRVLGWQGRAKEAAQILSDYLVQRPTDKEALLDLSRIETGRGGSQVAADLLERYRAAGGDELTYYHELALVLAWGGRLHTALTIADAGLAKDPNDFTFHFARSVILQNGYESGLAMQEAERAAQLRPNAPGLDALRRTIEVPQRPYLQIDAGARAESDHITNQTNDISFHQPINDAWWLFAGATTDYIDARTGTLFAPIQGGHDMWRGAGYVGTQARLGFGSIATARVGATGSGRGSAKPTWQVTADSKLSDDVRVQFLNTRDYQIVSPRSLSLGITRIDTEAQLTYTPDMLWTVVATAREAELSDRNRFLRGYIAPRRAVLRDQYWNVDFGVSGAWSGYSLKPLNGYYSPSFYQRYETNAYVYYKMSEEDGISIIVSLGAQKDETFHDFKFSSGVYTEATFGLLSDWMWKIRAGYTNAGASTGPNFSAEAVGMTLVKRF